MLLFSMEIFMSSILFTILLVDVARHYQFGVNSANSVYYMPYIMYAKVGTTILKIPFKTHMRLNNYWRYYRYLESPS